MNIEDILNNIEDSISKDNWYRAILVLDEKAINNIPERIKYYLEN